MTTPTNEPTNEPTDDAAPEPADHRWLYWTIGAVVVVVTVIGLFTFSTGAQDAQAQDKAQQLQANLRAAGLAVPATQDMIVRTLGTDGGAVCADPGGALARATLYDQLANGAGFVGRRPVRVDPRILAGELVVLQTYCPEQADGFKAVVDGLQLDQTIRT
jgi:hypothetical protein